MTSHRDSHKLVARFRSPGENYDSSFVCDHQKPNSVIFHCNRNKLVISIVPKQCNLSVTNFEGIAVLDFVADVTVLVMDFGRVLFDDFAVENLQIVLPEAVVLS